MAGNLATSSAMGLSRSDENSLTQTESIAESTQVLLATSPTRRISSRRR
jgi:hypothetical protein